MTARALGIPDSEEGVSSAHVNALLNSAINAQQQADNTHKPSMMLDMEKGSPMEVEVIHGEVVRLAKEHNVDIPVSGGHQASSALHQPCYTEDRIALWVAVDKTESNFAKKKRSLINVCIRCRTLVTVSHPVLQCSDTHK